MAFPIVWIIILSVTGYMLYLTKQCGYMLYIYILYGFITPAFSFILSCKPVHQVRYEM